MIARNLTALILAGPLLALSVAPALAQDARICLATADQVTQGQPVEDEAKHAAHEACLRALADSSNITQKYQLQEADFDIMGTRPKQ
jgi:hypothetical protein